MKVVNLEVYTETLKRAITANFASKGDKFGLCSEALEYKSTETPLAFYFLFIKNHLGDLAMYEEMDRMKITLTKKKSLLSLMSKLNSDVVNIRKHYYHIPYKRYSEGKMNLVKNYFKHKRISYEKFS